MKNNNILLISFGILVMFAFAACSKDEDKSSPPSNPPSSTSPALSIELSHMAGLEKFYLDSTYVNENGDEFTATMFKYYLSNIRLVRTNNSEYTVPNSYFLVNQDMESSMTLSLSNLSAGDYKAIRFILGVDSARNNSGAQEGALDPVNGMFWDWNTGYIFFKLEGSSPVIPTVGKTFTYHIGGFATPNVNYKEFNIEFDGDILTLAENSEPELHLVADVLETFKTPTTIDLATFSNTIMSVNANASVIAGNYADMFKYDHLHAD